MKKLLLTFSTVAVFLFGPSAIAKKKGSVYNYSISSEISRVRIQVQEAHIRLLSGGKKKGSAKKNKERKLKVKYAGELETDEDDNVFIISEESFPDEKEAWKSGNRKNPPVMTIWVPEVPIEIALFTGQVKANKLKKVNLSVFMPGKGSVQIENTNGKVRVFQGGGRINVHSYKGDLTVQAEDSHIKLQSCKGKINLIDFKGRVDVQKSSGHLTVESFKSPMIINNFTGRFDFRQERGGVYLKSMVGSVFGYSRQGEVRGVIQANEVNIETDTGKIHLDFPRSRAWLTAETWEGRIFTPRYFNRVKTGGMERSRGRLKGSKKKGNISLKSHSGSIKVYQSVH